MGGENGFCHGTKISLSGIIDGGAHCFLDVSSRILIVSGKNSIR